MPDMVDATEKLGSLPPDVKGGTTPLPLADLEEHGRCMVELEDEKIALV